MPDGLPHAGSGIYVGRSRSDCAAWETGGTLAARLGPEHRPRRALWRRYLQLAVGLICLPAECNKYKIKYFNLPVFGHKQSEKFFLVFLHTWSAGKM